MIYLSGVSHPEVRALAARRSDVGLLAQPASGYGRQLGAWPVWAADNGCYAAGDRFDLGAYLRWLDGLRAHAGSCLFAVAPDVVGDMAASWRRSAPVLDEIRRRGFPVALVAQNGLTVLGRSLEAAELAIYGDDRDPATDTGARIPWRAFDVLFIGGDDRYKLGLVRQHALVHAARLHGKPVHMGRVNSSARLQLAAHFGCTSADGTYLAFDGGAAGVRQLERWLDELWPLGPALEYPPTTPAPAPLAPWPGQLALFG